MAEAKVILNPYLGVNWQNQYKANLHSHTTESDGFHYGSDLIRRYKDKNYDVLVITDHDSWGPTVRTPREQNGALDTFTFPWSIFEGNETLSYPTTKEEDTYYTLYPEPKTFQQPPVGTYDYDESTGLVTFPDGYKMATTKGVEMSRNHHINVLFNGPAGVAGVEEEVIQQAQDNDSIIFMSHPSRYWKTGKYTDEWYKNLFDTFNSQNLVGIEVFNQNLSFDSRVLWDMLLTELMPNRTIWGFGNDDTHQVIHEFSSYNHFLLDDLTETTLKNGMIQGATYFSNEPLRTGEAKAPKITGINVSESNKTISITSSNAGIVIWYSGVVNDESKIVGYGNTFDYEGFGGNYVRAELINEFGTTCTQPFGIEPSDNPVEFPKNPIPIDSRLIERSFVNIDDKWRKIENTFVNADGRWIKSDINKTL